MAGMNYVHNLQEWQSTFKFKIRVKVRFSETDLFGHMNNTVPFTYFEEARIEYLKKIGFMDEWISIDSENIPVVADLQCDFIKQVYFDELIDVYVKIAHIGNSSIDLHYMGVNAKNEICFTGRNALVNLNRHTGRSDVWKEDWKDRLNQEFQTKVNV